MPERSDAELVVLTRWIWIRHAPVPGGLSGRHDQPPFLNNTEALDRLAARLPPRARWLVTPTRRSRLTAAALLQRLGEPLPNREDADLLEQDFGLWNGRSHTELAADLSQEAALAAFWSDPVLSAPPGGESFAAMSGRVADAIERWSAVAAADGIETVIMVGHAGPIRAAVGQAMGIAADRLLVLAVDCLHRTLIDRLGAEDRPADWRVNGINLPP